MDKLTGSVARHCPARAACRQPVLQPLPWAALQCLHSHNKVSCRRLSGASVNRPCRLPTARSFCLAGVCLTHLAWVKEVKLTAAQQQVSWATIAPATPLGAPAAAPSSSSSSSESSSASEPLPGPTPSASAGDDSLRRLAACAQPCVSYLKASTRAVPLACSSYGSGLTPHVPGGKAAHLLWCIIVCSSQALLWRWCRTRQRAWRLAHVSLQHSCARAVGTQLARDFCQASLWEPAALSAL